MTVWFSFKFEVRQIFNWGRGTMPAKLVQPTQSKLCAGPEGNAPNLVGNTILLPRPDGEQDLVDESLKRNSVL
jgi:hypothetical protein